MSCIIHSTEENISCFWSSWIIRVTLRLRESPFLIVGWDSQVWQELVSYKGLWPGARERGNEVFSLLSSSYPNNRTSFGSKGSSVRSQDRVSGSFVPWKLDRLTCHFIVVHSLSCVQFFVTPWTAACHASMSLTSSWRLLKFMSSELMIPSNHLILCCSLLLLPSVLPNIRVFSSDFTLHQMVKVLELQHQSFQWIFKVISFRIDWFDILAVQGTLKSPL